MVYYNYPTSGIGGALVRLDNMASVQNTTTDSQKFAAYGYLGAGTVVKVAYPAVTVSSNPLALTYWTSGGGYAGFDGLGRVVEQKWQIQSGGAVKDHFTYGYDANSSRLYRTNEIDHTFDELYHANGSTGAYDGLDRLKDFRRGTLTASNQILDTVATASRAQQWALDAEGNWGGFKSTTQPSSWDHEQTRDHNKANEITSISGGAVSPLYDLAGNMTTGPKPDSPATPQVCTYDAWNRLMTVSEGSGTPTLIVTYSYDGLNRRIRKVLAVPNPDVTYDYYYNESWQVLEVRKGGDTDPLEQYVWGLQYIDAPVVRFRDGNLDGDLLDTQDNTDSTLYYTYDAQFNVTALVDTSGTPQERYVYDPYGKVTVLNGAAGAEKDPNVAEWSPDADNKSDWDNEILFCGYWYDPETGLYHVRERYYDPLTGTWKTRDRILYPDGMSLYEYCLSSPLGRIDWCGSASKPTANPATTAPSAEDPENMVWKRIDVEIDGTKSVAYIMQRLLAGLDRMLLVSGGRYEPAAGNLAFYIGKRYAGPRNWVDFPRNSDDERWVSADWLLSWPGIQNARGKILTEWLPGSLMDKKTPEGKTIPAKWKWGIPYYIDYWDSTASAKSDRNPLFFHSGTAAVQGQFAMKCMSNGTYEGYVRFIWYDKYDWHKGMDIELPTGVRIHDSAMLLLKRNGTGKEFWNFGMWLEKVVCTRSGQAVTCNAKRLKSTSPTSATASVVGMPGDQSLPGPPTLPGAVVDGEQVDWGKADVIWPKQNRNANMPIWWAFRNGNTTTQKAP